MADRTSTVRVNVITDSSGAASKLGAFGRVAGAAALGVGALAVGAAVGANKLYDYADAADDANAKIENVVKTMGLFKGQTEEVSKRIQDFAKQTSLATAVDINSIKATQAKLLTFKDLAKTADDAGGSFDRATKAAVDMAALGFGTAESNAVMLGKALQDPANGLTALKKTGALTAEQIKTIGDEFQKTGDISKAQGDILAAVEQQVGGTAEATAGGFELMKNKLSIFGQELAGKALPYLDRFGTFMNETGGPAIVAFGKAFAEEVTPYLKEFGAFIGEEVIPRVQKLAKAFGENVLPKLRQFAGFVVEKVIPALGDFIGWIEEHVVPAVKTVLTGALEGARGLFKNVSDAVKDNEKPLRDMGDKLKKLGEFLADKVLPKLGKFYETVLPAVGDAIGVAITSLSTLWNAFNDIWDIVKKVIDAIGDLSQKIRDMPSPPPGTGGLFELLGRGGGGITQDSGLLPSKGNTVNIRVDGLLLGSEHDVARGLKALLDGDTRRYGPVIV